MLIKRISGVVLNMMGGLAGGPLYVAVILLLALCSITEGYKVRSCAGQEAHLNCPSGLYVDVISAVGGFGPSGTPCTSTASCTASYVQGALTEVNGNLGALFINTCKNKQTCSVMIQSSCQGSRADCNNQLYNIIYVDVEYKCTAPRYKVKSCAGQEAHLNCSSGLYVDVISAVGGFGTPCTSTASCTTSYVQGALTEVNGYLEVFLIKECINKQTCSVMIQSSWQGRRADCNNQLYNIIYVDVEYTCTLTQMTTSPTTESTPTVTLLSTRNSTNEEKEDVVTPASAGSQCRCPKSDWTYYIIGVMSAVIIILIIIIILMTLNRKRTPDANRADTDIDNMATMRSREDTDTTTSNIDSQYEHIGQPTETVTSATQVSQSGDVDNKYTALRYVRQ